METVSLTRMHRQNYSQHSSTKEGSILAHRVVITPKDQFTWADGRGGEVPAWLHRGSPPDKGSAGSSEPTDIGMQACLAECLGGFLALKGLSLACLVAWRYRRPSEWVG